MKYAAFGSHYEPCGLAFTCILEQYGCRSHLVGYGLDRFTAFGMNEYLRVWIFSLKLKYFLKRETFMYVTCSIPQHHVAACQAVDIFSEITVGTEYDFLVIRKRIHYLKSIARGDYYVGESFYVGCSVYVANDRMTRMKLYKFFEVLGLAAVGKRASGFRIRHENTFVGTKYLGCFSHEMHSAHHYYILFHILGYASQCQGVAYEVGHILYLGICVVMGHYHRALFFFKPVYIFVQTGCFLGVALCTHDLYSIG